LSAYEAKQTKFPAPSLFYSLARDLRTLVFCITADLCRNVLEIQVLKARYTLH